MSPPSKTDAAAGATAPRRSTAENGPLAGREVLVCVCGGIAAYKTAMLVSQLVQRGCGVSVAMTRSARRFVGPVTFEALSGRAVQRSLWCGGGGSIQHLSLGETADLIVVAPATANVIGKLAGGIADDLVSTLLLGAAAPVLLAPAMNTNMWAHPAVRRNVAWLRKSGFALVGPEDGWQACRAVGPGRRSEPDAIRAKIVEMLAALPKAGD